MCYTPIHDALHFTHILTWLFQRGGLDKTKKQWQPKTGKYLFKADNLAKVFRGKFIALLRDSGYYLPPKTPTAWVADCHHVGKGDSALTYLARYLYRGVINENNILSIHHDQVTFQYQDSQTKQYKTITEHATAFLWRVLQHVLPKGFRRARNYGFLHGNAKRTLKRLQLMLHVVLPPIAATPKQGVCCPQCKAYMTLYLMRRTQRVIIGYPI
ncbi:transposase [Colwellia sp. MSW7]|uniref:Transposase n=1 Tax=Colwellia maritima TaxID=2912588 RepID=A0ABS9X523_9GAMM|nr:transposase [Colwellia maritima]